MSTSKGSDDRTALDIRNLRYFVPSYQQPFIEAVATQRVAAIRKKWRLFSKQSSAFTSVSATE